MLSAARPHLLRIAGPNCVGLLVPKIGLNASFAHLTPADGRIAFLAQSGAVLTSVIDWAAARRIGFSHLVSPAALDDVALTLVKISQLTVDFGEIVELDVNPLLADASGVIALDARIRVKPADRPAVARLAIRPYPRELEKVVTLGDGATFLLRPIRPEDEPELQATFRRLSPETIRLRFFIPLRTLSHDLAARLTQIDYDREMALIVTEPGPAGTRPISGVVRIASDPDKSGRSSPSSCETTSPDAAGARF